jgi:hypothetical protein
MDSLTTRLGRVRAPVRLAADAEPPVEELLDVDREYREKATAGQLRSIAPRRFNPSSEAWLPVLHTQRRERALYQIPIEVGHSLAVLRLRWRYAQHERVVLSPSFFAVRPEHSRLRGGVEG